MRAIDLHCDTIEKLWETKSRDTLLTAPYSVNYDKLKKGGVLAQCFALFSPLNEYQVDNLTPWETVNSIHDRFLAEMKVTKGKLEQAYCVEDILANDKKGIISALLTIEDSGVVEGDIKKLEQYSSWGVKIASLTWNWENELAYPQSEDKNIMSKGLKKFGFEAIEYMNSANIVVDVSHLSDGGFYDVIGQKCKVVATHSNCRTLTNEGRNLTDEMIKAISNKGGVIGLNFCPAFLTEDKSKESRVADMVKHIRHLYNKGGENVLALGSDFDGITGKLELDGSDKFPLLEEALLKDGFKPTVVEKMWNKNILNLLSN